MRKKKAEKSQHEASPDNAQAAETHAEGITARPEDEPAAARVNDHTGVPNDEHIDASTVTQEANQDVPEATVEAPTGTQIVLSGGNQDVPDVTIEEPTYPAYEWQDTPAPPLIVPTDNMTDENLVAFILERQGLINNRLRLSVQDYWLIGNGLHLLFERHDVETVGPDGKKIKSRWREDWLPRLGYNHQTDQHLRALATEFTIEEIGQFANKTKALQALGFSVGGVKKAIENVKLEEAQAVNRWGDGLRMAEHLDKDAIEAAPQGMTNPHPVAKTRPEPVVQAKATLKNRVAAKVAPQAEPLENDPVEGTEALVVTLEGAGVSEIEPVVAESGFTLVAKAQDKIVGVMWYGQEKSFETARQRVHLAVGRLRDEKKKLKVEAHYLSLSEVIPV